MTARIALIAALLLATITDASPVVTLDQVTSSYGLNEHYEFQFPTSELQSTEADNYILDKWAVNNHGIQFGMGDIAFVSDPASSKKSKRADEDKSSSESASHTRSKADASTSVASLTSGSSAAQSTGNSSKSSSSSSASVNTTLRITYPQGSWSQGTGGTQFTAEPLKASSKSSTPFTNVTSNGNFERMLLSYDIFFPNGFQFNKGGKLPGLRGGPDPTGCSGGHRSDGMKCFSSRLMWRTGQLGEVYAYLPQSGQKFCQRQWVDCNKNYGTSLGRSTFSFLTGQWQTVWLYIELNEVGWQNGILSLYYNGVMAMKIEHLEFRKTNEIDSVAGFFFSTFFGGFDDTWATPTAQDSYFRNIQLFGGVGASNSTGPRSGATLASQPSSRIAVVSLVLAGLAAIAFV